MDLPNVYDLTNFNKKTHNIIVNLRHNESMGHLEITHDNATIIETHLITQGKNDILYNCMNSDLIMNFIRKYKMAGFYKNISCITGRIFWVNIRCDTIIRFNDTINIYFYKPNIPPSFDILSWDNTMTIHPFLSSGYSSKILFMIFSNDKMEPITYFDMNKMKYIKKYTYNVPDTDFKLVYMIYKFHNMIFIFNSHIIENDTKEQFVHWDEKEKRFHCHFDIVHQDIYYYCGDVDFKPVIGEYLYSLIYRYL